MSASITKQEVGGSIEYRIEGSPDDVQAEIEKIRERYPAAGYGTRVVKVWASQDGATWSAIVTRYRSCD